MKTWERLNAFTGRHCGSCGALIQHDAPVAWVTFPNITRRLLRCVACVGPAPPDLPARPEPVPPPLGDFNHINRVKPTTRGDLKRQAAEWLPYREA